MSIHSCGLGAPTLLEEAEAASVKPTPKGAAAAQMLVSNDLAQRRRLLGPEVYYYEGSHCAGHRCGFGPGSRCMQHRRTLRRSLWRALRRPSLWVARCRHMPLLLICRSSARCPSRHGLVLLCRHLCSHTHQCWPLGRYGKSGGGRECRSAPGTTIIALSGIFPLLRDLSWRAMRHSRPVRSHDYPGRFARS